jgi:Toprim domain
MDGQIIRELRHARNNKLVDLRQLAQALGGEVVGGQVLCPGPGHSARDRSLGVRPAAQSPFGFIAYSHAGDHWPTCRDYVLENLGWPSRDRTDALRRYQRPPQRDYGLKDRERRQHAKAAWLWSRRRSITGTPAEFYLRAARGYSGPIPRTLAFLPPAKAGHHPAMIAAFAVCDELEPGVVDEPLNVNSVHLTLLKPDGTGKANSHPNKLTVGRPLARPIAVAPPNDLLGLAIAEGIEDALTAHDATGLGAWAAGAAGFMPALASAVPKWIETVTIYAHADKSGRQGASRLAAALSRRGVEVFVEGIAL